MNKRVFRPFFYLGLFALLVGLACNAVAGSRSPTETPQPPPTDPPPPTVTQAPTDPPTELPTQAPSVEPTSTPRPVQPTAEGTNNEEGSALALSSSLYVHPQEIFEVYPPEDWEIVVEDDGSVLFEAPDASGAINVQVTNTGYELDPTSFERYVDGRDENFFIIYDEYQVLDREVNPENGTATVIKSLLFDGVPQTVISYYDQHGQVIYTLDFWADENLFDAYAGAYDEFFDAVTIDTSAAELQDLYLWVYDFYGPGDLFMIEVPTSWTYELSEGDFTVVDTFTSPDDHAVIQNIAYDDGEAVSRSLAGAFALELLNTYYADDIRITDDQVQDDGSERLIWHSPGGDYSGISFFETRGTTFLLFTVMYDNPYEDVYFDVLDYTVSTYEVP